jgi:DNA-binding transcriptional regulator YiaG
MILLHELTVEELQHIIRTTMREEMAVRFDKPLTTREVADVFGVSVQTIWKWDKLGKIKRINPDGRNARYSLNDIMNIKNKQK